MSDYGVGALGGVVLVDPATGLPYKAEGGGGGGSLNEVRHETSSGYDYTGAAPKGTATSAQGWTITRVTLVSPPVVEHASGSWDDRASLNYE